MMKNIALYIFVLAVLLVGCRGETPKRMPDTLPDVKGNITAVTQRNPNDKQNLAVISVEAVEGISSKYPKASIKIDSNTLIEDAGGKVLKPDVLQEGLAVEVWVREEVMESFPVQAEAAAMRITSMLHND